MRQLTLAHLYPREMNIYGDTGNVLVLRKRLEWRGYQANVVGVHVGDPLPADTDILLGGGGQDATQGEIGRDFTSRGPQLRAMADDGVVMLAICGSYQLLGHHFLTKDGRQIEGVGVLDVVTNGSDQRLIGNNAIDTEWGRLVGFENHSGLTELGPQARTRPRGRSGTTSSARTCTGRCWPRARASPTNCSAGPSPAAACLLSSNPWTTASRWRQPTWPPGAPGERCSRSHCGLAGCRAPAGRLPAWQHRQYPGRDRRERDHPRWQFADVRDQVHRCQAH
jgi:hypothetical protein